MACKFRTKFRHNCTYFTAIVVFILFWIIRRSPEVIDKPSTQINVELSLHERMNVRRHWIMTKYCDRKRKGPAIRKDLNLTRFVRPNFLQNFKNPCFIKNVTTNTGSKAELGCLPYFIVAGFPKTGTTDLWSRFGNHPDIVLPHLKEPMFFNKGKMLMGFKEGGEKYITFYSKTSSELQRHVCPSGCGAPFPYFSGITGEASVDTIFDNTYWQLLPGNEGCTEPVVTNADYVHHLNPQIKVILVLRNPVERYATDLSREKNSPRSKENIDLVRLRGMDRLIRLYSDYIYESRFFGYKLNPVDFHKSVQSAILNFTQCVQYNNPRSCVYNRTIDSRKVRLKIGIYHIYIEDWLAVFRPHNVLVIQSEDTASERKYDVYRQIFQFLQIRKYLRWLEDRAVIEFRVQADMTPTATETFINTIKPGLI